MLYRIFCLLFVFTYYFSFGNCTYYSFKRDFLVHVDFHNKSNFNNITKISFIGQDGYRDSVDLLELTNGGTSGTFLINRKIFNDAVLFFRNRGFQYEIIKNELDRKIKHEKSINRRQFFRRMFLRSGAFKTFYYMRYEEIRNWLSTQERKSNLIKIKSLGRTAENREILLAKISKDETKPILWIDGGIHAREWISPATAIFLIDKLLESSPRSNELLNKYQFYIVPLINADGYEYTHRVNRMWRKNRVRTYISQCNGVDLNRNYPYHWGENGASPDPCSKIYQGSAASSEKETKAIVKELTENKSKIKLFITLHSYGQYILSPYGYSKNKYPSRYYKLMEMGSNVASYLRDTYGNLYQVGTAANLLYEASGGSDDFAAGQLKIPNSYTIELPDRGRYGFLLPPTYIPSVGNQLWDALYIFSAELHN